MRRIRDMWIAVLALAGLGLLPGSALAATYVLRPDGDVTSVWSRVGAPTAWEALDDAVTRPTSVSSTDYIYACVPGRVTEVALQSRHLSGEVPAASQAWFYANTGADATIRVDVVTHGAVVGSATLGPGQGFAWRFLDWTPASPAAVDDARLRFTYSLGSGCSNVRAAYLALTTEPQAPPPPEDDVTAPETTIVEAPSAVHRSGVAQFQLTASEADSMFECRVDAQAFAPCRADHVVHAANGAHAFQARAIDAAGNVDPTPAQLEWWADGLLVNGTFETPLDGWGEVGYAVAGWEGWNAAVGQAGGGVVGGKLRVSASAAGVRYSAYSSPRPIDAVTAGTRYTVTGRARSERPEHRLCLALRERGPGNEGMFTRSCTTVTAAWTQLPEVTHVPAESGAQLEVEVISDVVSLAAGETFDLDALVLRDGAPLAVPVQPAAPAGDPVLLATADAALCDSSGDEAVARILDFQPGVVAIAGDTEQNDGAAAEFRGCYEPAFGRFKSRTRPAVGDHEYRTPGAAPYFDYFGAAAGARGKGWYSYDVGSWHVVVLNSNCTQVGGCGPGSEQHDWLAADLAATERSCIAAYFHHSLFSSGSIHGSQSRGRPFWDLLYRYGAEVVWSGNDHNYQRFARQTPAGVRDDVHGIRQFVLGTAGAMHYDVGPALANTQVQHSGAFGVLKLTLRAGAYDWEFLPQGGRTFSDSGSTTCSSTRPDVAAPSVTLTAPADGSTAKGTVQLSADATDDRGVAKVEFLVDGAVVASDTSAPYAASWDSTGVADGSVTIRARAADGAGNQATSAGHAVTVANGSPAAANLLPNPGFEVDSSGWYGYRGSVSRVDGGAEGDWSGRLTWGGSGTGYSIVTSPAPVSPSPAARRYTASAAVEAPIGKRICMRIRERNSTGVVGYAQQCLDGTGQWAELPTVAYTSLGGDVLDLFLFQASSLVSGDSFRLDRVRLAG